MENYVGDSCISTPHLRWGICGGFMYIDPTLTLGDMWGIHVYRPHIYVGGYVGDSCISTPH